MVLYSIRAQGAHLDNGVSTMIDYSKGYRNEHMIATAIRVEDSTEHGSVIIYDRKVYPSVNQAKKANRVTKFPVKKVRS